jgi:hypothetical protein
MRPNKTTRQVVRERTLVIASLVGVAGLVLGLAGPAEAANKTTKKVAKSAKATKPPKVAAKPKAAAAASAVKSVYPDAKVVDLGTGKDVSLMTLSADAKPTLIFVWAPS